VPERIAVARFANRRDPDVAGVGRRFGRREPIRVEQSPNRVVAIRLSSFRLVNRRLHEKTPALREDPPTPNAARLGVDGCQEAIFFALSWYSA
jgi:hypothetical protein